MQRFDPYLEVAGRIMLALIFVLSGVSKAFAFADTQAYMAAFGVPPILLAPTIAFEVGAGLALILGLQVRIVALLLAGFSLISAVIFHFDFGDQIQTVMFLKNLAMAGGLLLIVRHGAGAFALDRTREA